MSEGEFLNPIRNKIKSTFLRRKHSKSPLHSLPHCREASNLLSRRAVALKSNRNTPKHLSQCPSHTNLASVQAASSDKPSQSEETALEAMKRQYEQLQTKYIRLLEGNLHSRSLSQLSHISDANFSVASSRGKSVSKQHEELLHLKERLMKLDFSHFIGAAKSSNPH